MYAHQVIDSLKSQFDGKAPAPGYEKYFNAIGTSITQITNSFKFHLPSDRDQIDMFAAYFENLDTRIFRNSHTKYALLPYQLCWFDLTIKRPGGLPALKKGILVRASGGTGSVPMCMSVFDCYDRAAAAKVGIDVKEFWAMSPVIWYVFPNGSQSHKSEVERLVSDYGMPQNMADSILASDTALATASMYDATDDLIKKRSEEEIYELQFVELGLISLNTKGLVIKKHRADKKHNKKRAIKNKPPIYTYHTLDVEPGKEQIRYEENTQAGRKNRVHFCRGGIKIYDEKGLFGKHKGAFWFSPHVRGTKRRGVIMKDYDIKKGTTNEL